MKKIYIILICTFLATASVGYSDEPVTENGDPRSRERAEEMNQVRTSPDEIPAVVRAIRRERFRNSNVDKIQQTIEKAQQEGLPIKPLTDKVYEGIAKNVDEETIVRAVLQVKTRYRDAYRNARELDLDPEQEKPLGDLIAGAKAAGLANKESEAIMAALLARTRTMNRGAAQQLSIQTMTTARTMARRSVTSATVSEVLVNGLEQSYQARDMKNMNDAFMQRARYRPAEPIAQQLAQGIKQGLDATALTSASAWGDQKNDSTNSRGESGGSGANGADSSGGSGGSSGGSSGSSGGSSGSSGGSEGSGSSSGNSDGSGGSGGSSGDSDDSAESSSSSGDSGSSAESSSSSGESGSSAGASSSSGDSSGSAGSGASAGGQSGAGRSK